jgi:hypothetical protein
MKEERLNKVLMNFSDSKIHPHINKRMDKKTNIVIVPTNPPENQINVTPAEALHVIALYMKGQKVLYMEAKSHCERRLNMLMLPAIFNAAICTVISSALHDWQYGSVLLACLSAFNSCVLAIISYLKLDAKCEGHRASAFQFERLQNLCEFHSGKFLFGYGKEDKDLGVLLAEIETKMKEIKDSNQFMLPKTIRNNYSLIYTTNIFMIVRSTPARIHSLEEGFIQEMNNKNEGCFFKLCKSSKVEPEQS